MPTCDPTTSLFDTEARIIGENDRFAVIAIRLEKAALARNLLFLTALAVLQPPPQKPVQRACAGCLLARCCDREVCHLAG